MKYALIEEYTGQWPIAAMCDFLGVSRSSYYSWKQHPGSPRAEEDDHFSQVIRDLFEAHKGRYGSPRIAAEMRHTGYRISENRVAKLMREMGLKAIQSKKYRPQTTQVDVNGSVAPDLILQDFSAEKANQKWVGDITYIPCRSGFIYLSTVIDLFSRKVVGWSIDDNLEAPLVMKALRMAIIHRAPDKGVIFHSDRGCQYTSEDFIELCQDNGVVRSMGRTGCCYDNAAAESFFKTIKIELLRDTNDLEAIQIVNEVTHYIEAYFNKVRRHSHLDHQSPCQFEANAP